MLRGMPRRKRFIHEGSQDRRGRYRDWVTGFPRNRNQRSRKGGKVCSVLQEDEYTAEEKYEPDYTANDIKRPCAGRQPGVSDFDVLSCGRPGGLVGSLDNEKLRFPDLGPRLTPQSLEVTRRDPPIVRIRSPSLRPAWSAGPPGSTLRHREFPQSKPPDRDCFPGPPGPKAPRS